MSDYDLLRKMRLEVARPIYRMLVSYIQTGQTPAEAITQKIFEQEVHLWSHSEYWSRVQKGGHPAKIMGQEVMPVPDTALRVESIRNDLSLFSPQQTVFVFASSGTTDPTKRGIQQWDDIAAALMTAEVAAGWSMVLRDLGKGDFCSSLRFPTLEEMLDHFNRIKKPTLPAPESDVEKPFGFTIALFPHPYDKVRFPDFPVERMFVNFGVLQIAEMSSEEIHYPVVHTDRVPFAPDWPKVYDLLDNRSNKPVMIICPTPTHYANHGIYQVMHDSKPFGLDCNLRELGENDLIWSAGGDKRGKSEPASNLQERGGFALNALGSTHEGGAFWGWLLSPAQMMSKDFYFVRNCPLITSLAYSPTTGILPDGEEGGRLVVDLVAGASRPLIYYPGDRVSTAQMSDPTGRTKQVCSGIHLITRTRQAA